MTFRKEVEKFDRLVFSTVMLPDDVPGLEFGPDGIARKTICGHCGVMVEIDEQSVIVGYQLPQHAFSITIEKGMDIEATLTRFYSSIKAWLGDCLSALKKPTEEDRKIINERHFSWTNTGGAQ